LEIGLWQRDWNLGEFWVNWESFGQLGDFFGFSKFHRSNLLDKKLQLDEFLGNWEGLLVNWKIQNRNLHWNWTLEYCWV
jgi:hypothetical protein